ADLRSFFVGLFSSIGIAALAGAIYHGIYQHNSDLAYAAEITPFLKMLVLLLLGLTSYYIWRLFFFFALPQRFRAVTAVLLFVMLTAYFTLVLFGLEGFKVAIAAYLPPALLLTFTFAVKWLKKKDARYALGLLGLLLTLIAAGVQALKIGIHPEYFNHNALYHVIQAVGLYLIFKFAQRIIAWQS
ncbi:MAG: hypothetical protein AABZ31_11050, partial [Bdellovibrionota bacterium]